MAEITMSPYAYTWNDPVNYTDPTGMMGERIGEPGGLNVNKVYEGGVIEEIVLKGKKLNWLQRVGRFLGFGNSPSRNATAGTIPTMSQAPSGRTHNTLGQWTQAYRDYQPSSPDMFGLVIKPIINGGLDAANLLRNVNPLSDKRDYNGLATRMTKWDGNTMGGEEGQNATFNAILFADGLVTAGALTPQTTSVYRVQRTGQFLELDGANNVIYNSMNGKPKTVYMFVGDETAALNYARNKPGSTITKFEINSKYADKILEIKHPQELGLKSISASDANVVGGYNRIGVHSSKINGFLKWQKRGSGKIIKVK
ncbi:hypothetical protein [Chryseobacterium sp. R2ACT005]|uniref:hypothetical protein n=1 Tax=Chryseobacterium sp. R2ACT005 TaxID=3416668 RepID=UPI003CF01D13